MTLELSRLRPEDVEKALKLRSEVWKTHSKNGGLPRIPDGLDADASHYGAIVDGHLIAAFRIVRLGSPEQVRNVLVSEFTQRLHCPIALVGGVVTEKDARYPKLFQTVFDFANAEIERIGVRQAICVMTRRPTHFMRSLGWYAAGPCQTVLPRPTNKSQFLFVRDIN